MIARVMLLLVALVSAGAQAQEIKESYAFAVLGEPKYAFNFDHFDYVNPAAPKGGQMTLSAIGTFDNFNRYCCAAIPAYVPKPFTIRFLPPRMMNPEAITR